MFSLTSLLEELLFKLMMLQRVTLQLQTWKLFQMLLPRRFQAFRTRPPTHSSGNKPVLPSITIDKPDQRWALSSNKSSGFTFLVSASPGILSEPPTTTIMPSNSATVEPAPKDVSSSPYSLARRGLVMHLFFLFLQQATTLYKTMHLPIWSSTLDKMFLGYFKVFFI